MTPEEEWLANRSRTLYASTKERLSKRLQVAINSGSVRRNQSEWDRELSIEKSKSDIAKLEKALQNNFILRRTDENDRALLEICRAIASLKANIYLCEVAEEWEKNNDF